MNEYLEHESEKFLKYNNTSPLKFNFLFYMDFIRKIAYSIFYSAKLKKRRYNYKKIKFYN